MTTPATTPVDGHAVEERLPPEWEAVDHAIFEFKIRRGMPWRSVGEEVGLDWSAARRRFYRRMAAVTPAEIEAMRMEENLKLDEREHRARLTFAAAMNGQPVFYKGEPVMQLDEQNRLVPALVRDLAQANGALRSEALVATSRYKLNGLEAPVRIQLGDATVEDEIEAAVRAYSQGLADADAQHRATS